jgi:Ca2+-binding EF-hand superfamily protein
MALKMGLKETEEEVKKAFRLFDKDGTGKISLDNLREIATELGETLTDDELMDMLIEANPLNDSTNAIDI